MVGLDSFLSYPPHHENENQAKHKNFLSSEMSNAQGY